MGSPNRRQSLPHGNDWAKWVEPYAGEKAPARKPGKGKLKALEDAPGSFVKLRIDAPKEQLETA